MRPARKGDGTGLSFPGYSEVRTGDGDVVWSAGGDIPDSVADNRFVHYAADELSLTDGESVSEWPDLSDNKYDLTGGSPTFETDVLNGNPVVRFDGSNDSLDVSFAAEDQANRIYIVFRLRSIDTGSNQYITSVDDGSGQNDFYDYHIRGEWTMWGGGGEVRGGEVDTDPHIATVEYDSGNSNIRIDGNSVVSGDAGTDSLDGFTVGARYSDEYYANMDVGEIIVDTDLGSAVSDVEQYLSDKWGITI